jgi:hypothetical protein
MTTEMLQVDELCFELRRSRRRRTLEIIVGRRGDLRVYAPVSAPEREVQAWVRRKLLWVHRQLAKSQAIGAKTIRPEFASGENFSYLGRMYRLQLVDRQRQALRLDGSAFLLRRDAREKAELWFRSWYRRHGLPWLEERVRLIAPRLSVSPAGVVVRDLGYRWGSCNRKGGVYFHWKLLQLPVRLIDYVIVHEMAHLAVAHHGPAFWGSVERALPDWRERKNELAEFGVGFLRLEG